VVKQYIAKIEVTKETHPAMDSLIRAASIIDSFH
jgi:hypothetical protein